MIRPFNERIWFWVRTHRGRYALLILTLLATSAVAAFAQMSRTTQVSTSDAIAEYERRKDTFTPPVPPAEDQVVTGEATSAAASSSQPEVTSSEPSEIACDWICTTDFSPPEPGVYEYFQCGRTSGQCTGQDGEPRGQEKFGGGLAREFPRTGQRAITRTSEKTWNNIHYYADEHREEFDLSITTSGVFNHRYKIEIKVGPVPGGSELRQEPPLRFAVWPMHLGQTWNGSWIDSNRNADADYDCAVEAKEEVRIRSRALRTWVVACGLHLKGPKQQGEVGIRLWLSPELRNTVQEIYDQDLSTPQGHYEGQWMVTLADDRPKTN